LSGRVTEGADIVAGSGRGDADCLGSGTAMASIIAAQPDGTSPVTGIAPEATVLPIRLVHNTKQSDAAAEATAVEVAVSAGAQVVALGSFVDLRDPAVSAAITSALKHDVLVVAGAPTENVRLPAVPPNAPGALLSVAGVGADGQLAGSYQPGTVDVSAPGIEVPTLGTNGTGVVVNSGTQYAVAYAAGEAALIRAAYPHLKASQVRNRMRVTADQMGPTGDQSSGFGSGMINPSAALSATVPDETRAAPVDDGRSGTAGRVLAVVVLVMVLIVAITMLALRLRRWARPDDDDEDDTPHDPHSYEARGHDQITPDAPVRGSYDHSPEPPRDSDTEETPVSAPDSGPQGNVPAGNRSND
jgi:membrane-anchored mycosin MYCP